MKILFITENGFKDNVDRTFPNMRVEFAWMTALQAYHISFTQFIQEAGRDLDWISIFHYNLQVEWNIPNWITGFDWVFIIWPKEFENNKLLVYNSGPERIIKSLKDKGIKVAFIQEGPHSYFERYSLSRQFDFINLMNTSDLVLCHNLYDTQYYSGITETKVSVIPSVMIEDSIKNIDIKKEDKIVIGGNFCEWYGGLKSWTAAMISELPIYNFKSGRTIGGESEIINSLDWVTWIEYMRILSEFKYAVHLMPTVAAGTFSLNCAFFGIPCIGNKNIDTQRICFPDLSIDTENVVEAKLLLKRLIDDNWFYNVVSEKSKNLYNEYFSEQRFINKMKDILW